MVMTAGTDGNPRLICFGCAIVPASSGGVSCLPWLHFAHLLAKMNFVRLCTLVLSVLVVGKVLFYSLIHTIGKLNLSCFHELNNL